MRALLLAGLALLAVPGCSISHEQAGREFPRVTGELQVGRTTKADALALLGPPVSVRRQFDGDLLFWRRTATESVRFVILPTLVRIYERTDGTSNSDMIALLFDRDGLLSGIGVQHDIED